MNRRILVLLPLAALIAACANQAVAPASVAAVVAQTPDLSTFNGLVVRAGLEEQLKSAGPITVFAPTNEAFRAMPAKDFDALARNPAQLKRLIGYHVVPTRLSAADLKSGGIKTTQGGSLTLGRAGDYVTADEAVVQRADIQAGNGVVHTIDRVLTPPRH